MKTLAKLKFWSYLIFGLLFLLAGIFFFVSGKASEGIAKILMIAGVGQLAIFCGLVLRKFVVSFPPPSR